jgi:broad specificity phosphatase PhoE
VKFVLVRHGQTEWNKLGKFQGQVDIPLNEQGLAQAQDAARAAQAWGPTSIYASPLSRTIQVAEEIGRRVSLPVRPDPRLKELDLGKLDGITGEEMRRDWHGVYQAWHENPGDVPMPGGESLAQVQSRAWEAILEIESRHGDDDVLVVVSHNFTIRTIVTKLLGIPWSHFHNMALSLGSLSVIESGQRGRRLLTYNSTGHLAS